MKPRRRVAVPKDLHQLRYRRLPSVLQRLMRLNLFLRSLAAGRGAASCDCERRTDAVP